MSIKSQKNPSALNSSRTNDLSISTSDAHSGKLGKGPSAQSTSRTNDLSITSSDTHSGNSEKVRVLKVGAEPANDLPITSSAALPMSTWGKQPLK